MVLGGGGYNVSNVARAWALAWAVINGVELNEDLPEAYVRIATEFGIHDKKLRGDRGPLFHSEKKEIQAEVERVVNYIKSIVFPKVGV